MKRQRKPSKRARRTTPSCILYSVFCDPIDEAPFKPLGGTQYQNKRDAVKELRELQPAFPDAYLGKVEITRCLNT